MKSTCVLFPVRVLNSLTCSPNVGENSTKSVYWGLSCTGVLAAINWGVIDGLETRAAQIESQFVWNKTFYQNINHESRLNRHTSVSTLHSILSIL